ncbi:MAG: AAA family ATPase [Pyrobaculum sp.]
MERSCLEVLRKTVDTLRKFGEPCYKEEGNMAIIDSICFDKLPKDLLFAFRQCQPKLRRCLIRHDRLSSRRYPAWFITPECLHEAQEQRSSGGEFGSQAIPLGELVSLAKLRFESSPWVSVSTVRSAFEDVVSLLEIHEESEEPLHVLLLGPPGVGKSLILSFFDHPSAPLFIGATTTPKTLVEYLADTEPALIRFDEIDKADKKVVDAFLNAMSKGQLIFLTKQGRYVIPLKAPVLAAANEFERKVSESWRALQDRFVVVSIEHPNREEVERLVKSNIEDSELAERILSVSLSLRAIHKYIAMWRLAGNKQHVKRIILRDLEVKKKIFQ